MHAEQRPQRQGLSASARPFDDRESFRVAEGALSVLRRRCRRFSDERDVWEAFTGWRGRDERECLRRIRAGSRFIFYPVLQDRYDFSRHLCAGGVTASAETEHVMGWQSLARALSSGPHAPEAQSFEWPAHVDYARRECLLLLIHHRRGSLTALAQHSDRSSEDMLRKLVREFGLKQGLRAARGSGKQLHPSVPAWCALPPPSSRAPAPCCSSPPARAS